MPRRGGRQQIPRPPDWRPGDPAPWTGLAARELWVADVVESLRKHAPSELIRGPALDRPPEPGRASAVLIALYDDDAGATMILTRRSEHMRKHAGEIAFPGGAIDDTDESSWTAALREAHEEVNLDPDLPIPVGELDRFVTGASYSLVTPWVARLEERPELRPSPDEVEAILHVPLAELLRGGVYRQELWMWEGQLRPIDFFDLVGDTIWGATALMVHQLLDVLAASN